MFANRRSSRTLYDIGVNEHVVTSDFRPLYKSTVTYLLTQMSWTPITTIDNSTNGDNDDDITLGATGMSGKAGATGATGDIAVHGRTTTTQIPCVGPAGNASLLINRK